MGLKITPPQAKFELHAYGQTHDVSNFLLDWKQNEVILSRKDTSGVYREMTFPFKFVLDAYDIMKDIFEKHGFKTKADVYIYLRNNDWTYGDPYIFNLDFSTYIQSDTVIEINARRSDLYEHLKAKESVNYEIPVNDIKEALPWHFERIEFDNNYILERVDGKLYAADKFRSVGISYENTEIVVPHFMEEKTIADGIIQDDSHWFIQIKKECDYQFDVDIFCNLFMEMSLVHPDAIYNAHIKITKNSVEKGEVILEQKGKHGPSREEINIGIVTFFFNFRQKSESPIHLASGDRLFLSARFWMNEHGGALYIKTVQNNIGGTIKVSYKARHPALDIDLINPNTLLQKLVDKITGTEVYGTHYTAEIEDFNTDDQALSMLLATDSIRGLAAAKVYTSHKDFKAWMTAFGYEMHVKDNRLTYRKREKSLNKDLTAIELLEEDCRDLKTYIDNDYLFSTLKIGYQKKEYEKTYGRFEFNGKHDYTTDYTGIPKVLELISPYRADCYGIEFLAQERGKDTTDDKSDKDLFLVNVKKKRIGIDENYQTLYAGSLSGNVPNSTLFNTKFNPFELLKQNVGLLGASVNSLKFTASDANKDIIINGERIDGDYTIPEDVKLFDAVNYDFASRNIQDLPPGDNINGLVKIHYRGEIYEGFIKEISKNPAWETETQWILFKKHIPRIHPGYIITFENGEITYELSKSEHERTFTVYLLYTGGVTLSGLQVVSYSEWCRVEVEGIDNSKISINIHLDANKEDRERIAHVEITHDLIEYFYSLLLTVRQAR